MAGPTFYGMDPQQEYATWTWELFRCCLLRTLLSYNGRPWDQGGSEVRPDLAVAPPEISSDGLTWTFHLRRGLRYAPPLEQTEITARDIVRALLRAGDPDAGSDVLARTYLSPIRGFTEYQRGKSSSISGLETPDRYTLRVHQTTPDGSLAHTFALPMTAPIPPSPVDRGARYGVAEGHAWNGDFDHPIGYGQFLVASGPYMFEGSEDLDFSLPANEQSPVSGFEAARLKNFEIVSPGSMKLVRNPSWDPSTDRLRAAVVDRMEIQIGGPGDLFAKVRDGTIDMVYDAVPPPRMLQRYISDDRLRSLIETTEGLGVLWGDFNVAQPPFDDVAVRRAVTFALDRSEIMAAAKEGGMGAVFGYQPGVIATHLAPDPTEGSLLSDWDPYPSPQGRGDLAAARAELDRSPYARDGRCVAQACRGVEVLVHPQLALARRPVGRALSALGIEAQVVVTDDFHDRCGDPREHWGMCIGDNWFLDVPDAGNLLNTAFRGGDSLNYSLIGSTGPQLRNWGYDVGTVASVDADLDRCIRQVGSERFRCWAEVDQKLMEEIVPAVPICFFQPFRVTSPRISQFSWDQAYVNPALDRLVVAPGQSGA
jgi:peptide/nickel transport system substrate-binding protein